MIVEKYILYEQLKDYVLPERIAFGVEFFAKTEGKEDAMVS